MEVILSVKFGYEKTPEIDGLLRDFKDMVNFCIDKAVQHKATSISKLHRLVYGELSQRYDYSRAFFPTAYRVALSIVRGWRFKGEKPVVRKAIVKLNPMLCRFEGERLRISVKPRKFVYLNLEMGSYQRKFVKLWRQGKAKVGEPIINERWVIIPLKQQIDLTKPNGYVALDLNETNVTAYDGGEVKVFDLTEVKRLHHVYFKKRRSIQKKIRSLRTKVKVLAKYREREKRRVNDVLHKVSKRIVETFKGKAIILEDLKGIRNRIDYGRRLNRRLHSWNFRRLQLFIHYKANLNNRMPIFYVNPRDTSKVCPRCGGRIDSSPKCPTCGLDRHVAGAMNILAKYVGSLGSPRKPLDDLDGGSLDGTTNTQFTTPI